MADLNIDVVGSPSIIADAGKSLTIGIATTGFLSVFTGGGSVQIPVSSPAEGTVAAALVTSGTVTTTVQWQRVISAGAITGVILAAGTVHGQVFILTSDKDSGGTITAAAAGTSRIGTGTGCIIPVGGGRIFIWDNTDLIWNDLR